MHLFFGQVLAIYIISRCADGIESLFQARHVTLLEGNAKVENFVSRRDGLLHKSIRNRGAALEHLHCVERGVGPCRGNEGGENEESSAHVGELLRLQRSRGILKAFCFKPLYSATALGRYATSSHLFESEIASMRISTKPGETSFLNGPLHLASSSKFTFRIDLESPPFVLELALVKNK